VSLFEVHQGDAVAFLEKLPSKSVDCIVTDPAYESLEKHRAKGTTTRLKKSAASSNEWFEIFPNARFLDFLMQCWRVMKNDRHLYMYTDQETMFYVVPIAAQCGLRFAKPLVWNKYPNGGFGMGYHYRAKYELILFFEKGDRMLNSLGLPDMIECPMVKKQYPTEKPVPVSEILIKQSTAGGQLVVDPFMGSGSVGEAAILNGRRFIGNDLSSKSFELAASRLAEVQRTRCTSEAMLERQKAELLETYRSNEEYRAMVGECGHESVNRTLEIPRCVDCGLDMREVETEAQRELW
jgi:site-specific DNA-methyltransferase (adenine-specific)